MHVYALIRTDIVRTYGGCTARYRTDTVRISCGYHGTPPSVVTVTAGSMSGDQNQARGADGRFVASGGGGELDSDDGGETGSKFNSVSSVVR